MYGAARILDEEGGLSAGVFVPAEFDVHARHALRARPTVRAIVLLAARVRI